LFVFLVFDTVVTFVLLLRLLNSEWLPGRRFFLFFFLILDLPTPRTKE